MFKGSGLKIMGKQPGHNKLFYVLLLLIKPINMTIAYFKRKSINVMFILILFCLCSGCATQRRHHKPVPCPCEKNR